MKAKMLVVALAASLLPLPVPEASAAPGVAPWNRNCQRAYAQWKKKPKHKAFAVVDSASSQGCGSSWGAKSVKAAEDAAAVWCRKASEGGGYCRVTASE